MSLITEQSKKEILKQFDEIVPVMRMIKDYDPGFYNELKDKLFPSKQPFAFGDYEFSSNNLGTLTLRKVSTDVAFGKSKLTIKDVIFNDPATIVMWSDGSKTVVKCQPGDVYSEELGLAMAISKKFLGNKGNFNDEFKKWIPEKTVQEMRERLFDFCDKKLCFACPLESPVCRCGCGTTFLKEVDGKYDMTDGEIRDAYKIVFGDK